MSDREQVNLNSGLRRGAVVLACLLALGAGVSWYEGLPTRSPFPIIDSGVWAEGASGTKIYWLDDETLVFVGTPTGEFPRGPYPGGRSLMKWSIGHDASLVRPDVVGICYRREHVWQVQVRGSKRIYWAGAPGRESAVEPGAFFDRMNCRYRAANPGEADGRSLVLLLDGHGYLDVGAYQPDFHRNHAVTLHRPHESRAATLPFGRWSIGAPIYHEFKDAYLFMERRYFDEGRGTIASKWPRDIPRRLWWLEPSGNVSPQELPLGPWNEADGSIIIVAVTPGYVVIYHGGTDGPKDPGRQGAYFVGEGAVTKFLDGYVTSPVTSPNGCRLAVSHAPAFYYDRADANNRRTLKVIDFCR